MAGQDASEVVLYTTANITYPETDVIVAKAAEYMALTINGVDDAKGLKIVHDARMQVADVRISIEKRRVELKAPSIEYGKRVDAEAKRLTAIVTPIEESLRAKEKAVEDEKDRIKNAARIAAEKLLTERMEKLTAVEAFALPAQVAAMTDDAFAAFLATKREACEQKQAEAEKLERERQALEREKSEQERQAAERFRLAQEQLDAERKAFAEEQRLAREQQEAEARVEQKRQQEELDKKASELAEKERVEAERLAKEQADAERAAAEERARPIREKLDAVADTLNRIDIGDIPAPYSTKVNEILDGAVAALAEIEVIE